MSKKRVGCLVGVAALIFLGSAGQAVQTQDVGLGLLTLAGAVAITFWLMRRNVGGKPNSTDRANLTAQATMLEALADNLPFSGPTSLMLGKDEHCVARLESVDLIEMRSNGSSYQGGSQGFSIRIMKGVSYRVGASRGQLVKNPESLRVIDTGSATFTNKRVVFTGQSASREWAFEKALGIDVTGNGTQVMLSVSNRQKTSGLQARNYSALTPGVLVAIANDYFTGGLEAAKQRCLNTASGIRALLNGASEAESTSLANPTGQMRSDHATSSPSNAANADQSFNKNPGPRLKSGVDEIEVVGESFYIDAFSEMRISLGAEPGETVDADLTLLAEPFNKFSKNGKAVAVQHRGNTLGHISEEDNAPFFDLLTKSNGSASCNAEVYFDANSVGPRNSIRLLCALPPELE